MQKIHYLKIQNFKIFGEETTIDLENVSILIGSNNSGKTSAIQALALWSWALKVWFEKKGTSKSKAERNKGVSLNRLEIAQVPIKETRYFWNLAKVRQGSTDNIGLTVTLGLWFEGKVRDVGMIFKYHSPELMYCQPKDEDYPSGLLEYAKDLKINLLYPMSGISDREFVFHEEAIKTQIGIGQTANVLRNICYHLFLKNKKDWSYLQELMRVLFSVDISEPFVRATGVIELLYNYSDKRKRTDYDLDITMAGRGQQQMLLVLAYLMSNDNAVLMIDEPDAHLEVLRQSQIFAVVKEVANKYDCQLIIVTHSEVVLNEASSINFIIDGKVIKIDDRKDHKFIKDALKNFGLEHYYKARLNPHILYVESSTDIDMLRAFAQKANHKSLSIFNERLNFYYTHNETSVVTKENELERKSGAYRPQKSHFQALQKVVPELKAIGLFDGDNRNRQDESQENYAIYHWKRYELENYFVTPKVLMAFAEKELENRFGQLFTPLKERKLKRFREIIDTKLVLPVLGNDTDAFREYKELPENMQNIQFQSLASSHKLSAMLEDVFQEFAESEKEPLLLTKGNFYRLIDYLDNVPKEIIEKLEKVCEQLADEKGK